MEATLQFNLPDDEEQFNVAVKSMEWALLVWDVDQIIRTLLKYHSGEYETGVLALEHMQEEIRNLMEEKGLQFPA